MEKVHQLTEVKVNYLGDGGKVVRPKTGELQFVWQILV